MTSQYLTMHTITFTRPELVEQIVLIDGEIKKLRAYLRDARGDEYAGFVATENGRISIEATERRLAKWEKRRERLQDSLDEEDASALAELGQ